MHQRLHPRFTYSVSVLLLIPVLLALPSWRKVLASDDPYAEQRARMLQLINADVETTSLYLNKQALDPEVMAALGKVWRHEFVDSAYRASAYENRPLPIGHGQTISQPFIVAIMTDLLKPQKNHRALEIGTGSGYQAAILAELVEEVYTIEIIEPLSLQAATRLARLGYKNVHVKQADGYYGWPQYAPFDIIVVTAAAGHIPPPLIQQLKPGGLMILPVGSRFMVQQLVLVEKSAQDAITTRQILPVLFVPLTGGH